MSTASPTQKKDSAILSRSDLEELIQRETKPGSPVLSVYLNCLTNTSATASG